MSLERFIRYITPPQTEFIDVKSEPGYQVVFELRKVSEFEVCPKCATATRSVYDHRLIKVRQAPIFNGKTLLLIWKRRFCCRNSACKAVFTEPVPGIKKGHRTTQKFKEVLGQACQNFTDLKRVMDEYCVSSGFVYETFYEQLELARRKRQNPWPEKIGLDEHSFKRNKYTHAVEFVTIVVEHKNHRVREIVEGRSKAQLMAALSHIPGRENVKFVTQDLSAPYREFSQEFFPNAKRIADKFHVIRLFCRHLRKERIRVTGDVRKHPMRKLVHTSLRKLSREDKEKVNTWLLAYPELGRAHTYKEKILSLYRIKGETHARHALINLLDEMAKSKSEDVKALRETILNWQQEILNYFSMPLTNARLEGFNNKCKLTKRRAYGFKSFKNYRLRVLQECA